MKICKIEQGLPLTGNKAETATVLKGRSPYIGVDGFWYEWDDETQSYINSGVSTSTMPDAAGVSDYTPLISIGEEAQWGTDAMVALAAKTDLIDVFCSNANEIYTNEDGDSYVF